MAQHQGYQEETKHKKKIDKRRKKSQTSGKGKTLKEKPETPSQ